MIVKKYPYQDLRFFSDLMSDYLDEKDAIKPLYHRFPKLENFKSQIEEKQEEWKVKSDFRDTLASVLESQYKDVEDKEATAANIKLLQDSNTFTITTGHQLNLFTGPFYFLYKIISAINLCKQLKKEYGEYNFVPVYWMATEDHDFEEIQYFNYDDKKIVYDRESAGAVGRLSTKGLDQVFETFSALVGNHDNAQELKELFKKGYLAHDNLADATRYIAHQLFKDDGLVIVEADHQELKKLMIPYFKEELLEQSSFQQVSKTLETWPQDYNIQVNPREINLFYLTDEYRKRIIKRKDRFYIDEIERSFSEEELLKELEDHPERFSPNVIMRPLYQELILPNICYIGGGGEMAYWLELKNYFQSQKVTFPIVLMRNSALVISEKQLGKVDKLPVDVEDLFLSDHDLSAKVTRELSKIDIDFTEQKEFLQQQFKDLYDIAGQTDVSFLGAVGAQERKQIKGLEHLEKRLLKAQKRKLSDHVERTLKLQKELFPNNSLQERQANFSFYYQEYGKEMIDTIKSCLDPLDMRFTIIQL
jgi:bacillithiol biosynthesis cysteine-adding enzyme BshC